MRDDEDNIRQYLPVLRRIIILVAVLTAIPMVMWTITAFVRSHIGPPRAPALQPMAIAPANPPASVTVAAEQPPASSAGSAQASPLNPSAYAGGTDGTSAAPADATPTATTTAFKTVSVAAPSDAAPDDAKPSAMPPAPSDSASDAAASPADSGAPDQSSENNNGTQVAARSQDPAWPASPTAASAALPAGEPISGPVPLPRKRPTSFAMAGNVPLPAPRPQAAGGGGTDSSPTAIDWLKKVFHSPPAQSSDSGSDIAHQ